MSSKAKSKSITFLMPARGSKGPSGGFKIVYEYANRLADDGFEVHIAYPVVLNFKTHSLKSKIRTVIRYFVWLATGVSGKSWFPLNPSIKEHLVLSLNQRHVPKTDYYVATAVKTAYYLADYKKNKTNCLYLIQDYEAWGVSDSFVDESYRLGLRNIAISDWLRKKVAETGVVCRLIRNAFDFDYFKITIPIDSPERNSIAMLYHDSERKGCKYGIEAIKAIHEDYPQIKFRLFGRPERPRVLPQWIEYYCCPDQKTHNFIYNHSLIYLAPSIQEGWGLTVGEAMICGACVVCSDTLGFREMIQDGRNGRIVPVADSQAMVYAVSELIRNPSYRLRLAAAGERDIHKFNWETAYHEFRSMLED